VTTGVSHRIIVNQLIVFGTIHFAFNPTEQSGRSKGHNEVDYASQEEDFEVFVVNTRSRFGREVQFSYGNYVQYGSIFNIDDKVVT
jgi:hypothetical protein